MTDLERFRVYARTMATAEHTPTCAERRAEWVLQTRLQAHFDVPDPGPRPECDGCVTDDDRALWARLADEATAYLDEGPTLWEDA